MIHHFMVKGITLRTMLPWLVLGCFLGGLTLAPVTPALAQASPAPRS